MRTAITIASLCLFLMGGILLAGCAAGGSGRAPITGGVPTTPLMLAVQAGDLLKVKSLVEQGADLDAYNVNGVSVLSHAIPANPNDLRTPQRAEVARYLIEIGAKPYDEKQRHRIAEWLEKVAANRPVTATPSSASRAAVPLTVAPVLRPGFPRSERPDDYAVIVGIENYSDLPSAMYAERDAAAVRNFVGALGVPERNIMLLTGGRATKTGLEKILEAWLPNNVSEKSRVYVYYSGHGAPDTKTGDAYLVPSDGDPQYLAQTGYPLKRLYAKLGALKAKSVLVALDSCFSGAGGRSVLAKGTRPLVGKVDMAVSGGGKVSVISASAGDQISGAHDEAGYGLFTYNFLRGLNGAAKDAQGRVTLQSLYGYLKPRVQDEARRGNRDQTPQLQSGSEDLILRAK